MAAIDDVLETVFPATSIPVIVLGEADMRSSLKDLIHPDFLRQRDHELPAKEAQLKLPLVLLSGLAADTVQLCLSGLRASFPQVLLVLFFAYNEQQSLDDLVYIADLSQGTACSPCLEQVDERALRRNP